MPQSWREADIRPIPNPGSDLKDISSLRPISLTSYLGKAMERIVANRMMYFLESRCLLNDNQAGFRQLRGTEDQIITLSQTISDGFQCKPMRRTLAAFLDYHKAYDTVRRDGLLLKMIRKGIPKTLVRWTQAWLSNRRNWVTIDRVCSKKAIFRQGVHQGAIISPLLFLLLFQSRLLLLLSCCSAAGTGGCWRGR